MNLSKIHKYLLIFINLFTLKSIKPKSEFYNNPIQVPDMKMNY